MPTGFTPPFFLETFHYPNGQPLSGGRLWFYVAGNTDVPKQVFADRDMTIVLEQPLILDASGTAEQYFMQSGLYKIVLQSSTGVLVATRDYVDASGGTGSGEDAFTVKADPTDTAPATLIEKIEPSSTVTWSVDTFGGVRRVQASVNVANVLDYKIKADPSDPDPDFLDAKVQAGYYVDLWVNPTTHKLIADFTGPAYVPATGGVYTGPVTIPTLTSTTISTTTLNVSGNAVVTGTATIGVVNATSVNTTNTSTGTLTITGLAGVGNKMLMVNSSGTVYRGTDPYTVKISSSDPTPGYLGTKIFAGPGIALNVSNDPINGDNINISLIDIPVPLALPAGQVGYGNGTGVTSSSRLTYVQPGSAAATMLVDKTELDTYYVGGHQYVSWANVSASGTNFRDAINQRDDGNIVIGGGGDSGAIKLTPSTRAVDFGIFSTVSIGGKFIGPSVDESLDTSYVPELLPGEEKVVRFIRPTGTTLMSNSAQVTYYRSSTTGVSAVAAVNAQVDGALVFGSGASQKVGVIKFIGVSSTAVQAVY